MKKTFSVVSLGCFRNTYDSEVLSHKLSGQGYVFSPHSLQDKKNIKKTDTFILNTCGFIDKAKEESLEAIKEVVNLKKKGLVKKIVVLGCLAQRYKDELKKSFPQVDKWQGVQDFSGKAQERIKILPLYMDFLKICEGCLNKCSFCAIPLIKGPLKSKSLKTVVEEVRQLDRAGTRELNIIGQDITSWGRDFKKKKNLTGLLKKILKEAKNIRWIRLIYTHPKHFDDSLIELIAKEKKICRYIDLPIQHINDRILKLMNRGITKKEIITLIKKIRKKIPNCVIRTSVIVGFPGETQREFKELLDFLGKVKFERLGAFIYSREESTPAYDLPVQVHPSTKARRFREVMKQQQQIAKEVASKFIGREIDILVEGKKSGIFVGRSQYDAPEVDGLIYLRRKGLKIGEFYRAKIVDSSEYDLVGV